MQSLIFVISVCGYFFFYLVKMRKHPSLFPALFVSFVSSVLFFFGLTGKLYVGLIVINSLGILLGALSVLITQKDIINALFRPILFPTVLFFVIGLEGRKKLFERICIWAEEHDKHPGCHYCIPICTDMYSQNQNKGWSEGRCVSSG